MYTAYKLPGKVSAGGTGHGDDMSGARGLEQKKNSPNFVTKIINVSSHRRMSNK
jgi:hypothetical protein